MKIFVSAAEISSDLQAEKIIHELIRLFPNETVEIAGIGGPKLRTLPNFKTVERAENLRAMGFTEVFAKLFSIRRILKRTIQFLKTYQPDLILTFDYPDFHFALLKACAKIPQLNEAVKICGIPPKIWVWRAKRIEKIRELYHAVWVLFPFEQKLYEDAGIPVIFEGNPLIGDVVSTSASIENEVAKKNWQSTNTIRLAVMPGSREAEIKVHLKIIPETLELFAKKSHKNIIADVPVPLGIPIERITSHLKDSAQVTYHVSSASSSEILARNELGLIKSGTSTLEAAVLGCVPIIFYRVSFVTRLIFQFLIRYDGAVGLPNILLGVQKRNASVFPEFLGPEATPEALSEALSRLVKNPHLLSEKQKAGESLRILLVPTGNIPFRIAEKIKWILDRKEARIRPLVREKRISVRVISFLWSTLNFFRRKFYEIGFFESTEISLPSVLVGNLQAGGAGKTPLVIAIAHEAIRRGFQVGVISRGYGGSFKKPFLIVGANQNLAFRAKPEIIGDEPAEILQSLPEVSLGLGANRVQVARELEKLGINFLIFDDGFQNLKFRAKKTVIAVTDARPSELVFRDFFDAAEHADLVLQTKGFPKSSPISATKINWDVDSFPDAPVWLLCGVADPREVAHFYRSLGLRIDRVLAFPDHAKFNVEAARAFQSEANAEGATLAVTEKDWVKLKSDSFLTPLILRRKIRAEGWLETVFER
jgi:lipid-A-disaccharide synthase